ncbi:MAG: hypothetical protein IPP11_01035 [Chitinophagaceae bacterium]|jgi:hypothetical protein|nr:hypothetical protein [Chitinophagaceae bacterium]
MQKGICFFFLLHFFYVQTSIAQSSNFSPLHGIYANGSIVSFNSYLKNNDYKKYINNSKDLAAIGYFHRIHDGAWYSWYLAAALGYKKLEYNSWDDVRQRNTYTSLSFIQPSLYLRMETTLGRTTKFFIDVGYAYCFNTAYRIISENGNTLLNDKLSNIGSFKGAGGMRLILTEKWSLNFGIGGDFSIGKKLVLSGKSYQMVNNSLILGTSYSLVK